MKTFLTALLSLSLLANCSSADENKKVQFQTYQGFNAAGEESQCSQCLGDKCTDEFLKCEDSHITAQSFLDQCVQSGGSIVGENCDCGVRLCSIKPQ